MSRKIIQIDYNVASTLARTILDDLKKFPNNEQLHRATLFAGKLNQLLEDGGDDR